MSALLGLSVFVYFNDTATTEIYTLSIHDALPISRGGGLRGDRRRRGAGRDGPRLPPLHAAGARAPGAPRRVPADRKITRLNSSHANISYAVFCLKKKKYKTIYLN